MRSESYSSAVKSGRGMSTPWALYPRVAQVAGFDAAIALTTKLIF
jgi:hypothetical protein